MKFLLDNSAAQVLQAMEQHPNITAGQLLTPLTNYRLADDVPFAVDNGAYSDFDERAWERLLHKAHPARERCLFVCMPDVVGSHEHTLRKWLVWAGVPWFARQEWPLAFVAQDGFVRGDMPAHARALFIGGTDTYKESACCVRDVRWAVAQGLHVHVGRVNTAHRWRVFNEAGAHTCDGSGVSRPFSGKLRRLSRAQSTGSRRQSL